MFLIPQPTRFLWHLYAMSASSRVLVSRCPLVTFPLWLVFGSSGLDCRKRRCKKSDEVMYGNILINADSWKCRGHLLLCKFHRLEALDSIIMIGYRCTFLAPTSFYFQFAPPVCFPIEQHVTKLIRLAVAYSPRGLPDQTTRADPIRAQRIRFGGGGTGQTLDQTVKP